MKTIKYGDINIQRQIVSQILGGPLQYEKE